MMIPGTSSHSVLRRRPDCGFSLVEVTLAMGIASFALLVIFSMMPTGLSTMQEAGRQIAETEIFNRLGAELSSTPLYDAPVPSSDVLSSYVSGNVATGWTARFPAYFDIEGNEVKQSGASNIVFTVQCKVTTPDPGTWAAYNSDNTVNPPPTFTSYEMRYATLSIGFHQDPNATTPNPNLVRKRVFLLANKGT